MYAPYWFTIARCPPLTLRLLDKARRRKAGKIALPFHPKKNNEVTFEEITEEEMFEGYTIASALNFKFLDLSVSITQSGGEQFGPAQDLSPLGDMVDMILVMYNPCIIYVVNMNLCQKPFCH